MRSNEREVPTNVDVEGIRSGSEAALDDLIQLCMRLCRGSIAYRIARSQGLADDEDAKDIAFDAAADVWIHLTLDNAASAEDGVRIAGTTVDRLVKRLQRTRSRCFEIYAVISTHFLALSPSELLEQKNRLEFVLGVFLRALAELGLSHPRYAATLSHSLRFADIDDRRAAAAVGEFFECESDAGELTWISKDTRKRSLACYRSAVLHVLEVVSSDPATPCEYRELASRVADAIRATQRKGSVRFRNLVEDMGSAQASC